MTIIKMNEMQLGDVVERVSEVNEGYTSMTVKKIADGQVTFYRPYVHANPTVYSGNSLITYIGLEEFSAPIRDDFDFKLLYRLRNLQ